MTAPEETFRRVLAARLPAGPGWTAWIDGTVQELAAADAGRRTVERDTIRDQEQRIQAVLNACAAHATDPGAGPLITDLWTVLDALPAEVS